MKKTLLLCLLLVLFITACGSAKSTKRTTERTPCKVLRVFDGDTLVCDLNGNGRINKPREYIRLLGIDAPETHHSKRGTDKDEPFSIDAMRFLAQKTLSKTVYLEWDQERRDPYDRSLAFVYLKPNATQSINAQLVERGLASTLFIPPNRRYRENFEALESQARQQQRGIWHPTP